MKYLPELLHNKHKKEISQELKEVAQSRRDQLFAANNAQGFDRNITNHEQFREFIIKRYGDDILALLDEKLPTFMRKRGRMTPYQIGFIGRLLKSSTVSRFRKSLKMVKLNPKSPVNRQAQITVALELAKLPMHLLNRACSAGLTIVVTDNNVTTYLSQLSSVVARGYQGGTWDSIPGVGAFGGSKETVIAVVKDFSGKWQIGKNHTSANLVLHEFGHSIDRILGSLRFGENFSKTNAFYSAYVSDFAILDPYYQQKGFNGDYEPGLEESFAEGLARVYGDHIPSTRWKHIETELLRIGPGSEYYISKNLIPEE